MAEEQVCIECRSVLFENPNLQLLIAQCLHLVCDTCVAKHLATHESFPCATCGVSLRREGFRATHSNTSGISSKALNFEKEKQLRKRMSKVFNRIPSDFETIDDYENYVEWVEDITYNMAKGINRLQMDKIVEKYKKENQLAIVARNQEQEQERRRFVQQIQAENRLAAQRTEEQRLEMQEEKEAREQERIDLLNQMQRGQLDAEGLEYREAQIKAGAPTRKRKKKTAAVELLVEEEAPTLQYVPASGVGLSALPRPVNAHSLAHILNAGQREISSTALEMSAHELAALGEQGPAAGYTAQLERDFVLHSAFDKLFV